MNQPEPTRALHEQFCRVEGWQCVREDHARTGVQRTTYEFTLPDGRMLRTRVAYPNERDVYGPDVWKHILRDQLQIQEQEFWACVRDGVLPDRGLPKPAADALPVGLVHLLLNRVGLTESEVMEMSKDEAIARLNRHWAANV